MEIDLKENNLTAFSEVNVVPEFEAGIISIAQANGIAGLQSNTVMFGWPKKQHRFESQLRTIRAISEMGKSSIIARLNWRQEPGLQKRIDLWWGGLQHNGDLMLLLAYLLSINQEWSGTKIVIHSIVKDEREREEMDLSLANLIAETRIQAEPRVIVKSPDQSVHEVIHTCSRNAAVVFIGLNIPKSGSEAAYAEKLTKLSEGLRTVIFVRNAGEFAGSLIG